MSAAKCPGCGVELPDRGAAERMRASQACWELYGELAAYTLARGRGFLHQYGVDAYQAQHADPGASGITIAFSLIGLYLASERGWRWRGRRWRGRGSSCRANRRRSPLAMC